MRIDPKALSARLGRKPAAPRSADSVDASFADVLAGNELELADRQLQLELQDLRGRIDQAAQELDREPSIHNLEAFRNLIVTLTRKVTANAYRLEQVMGGFSSAHCQDVIRVIDREADALLNLIMQSNRDRLKITAKILEIRGLIVDILS